MGNLPSQAPVLALHLWFGTKTLAVAIGLKLCEAVRLRAYLLSLIRMAGPCLQDGSVKVKVARRTGTEVSCKSPDDEPLDCACCRIGPAGHDAKPRICSED